MWFRSPSPSPVCILTVGVLMSRSDTLERITKCMAIIHHQTEDLAADGLYRSRFTEDLVRQTVEVASGSKIVDLNSNSGNFPGIDLRSADGTIGYQATRSVTKTKHDKTASAIIKELARSDCRVRDIRKIYVVGIRCVKNPEIQRWSPLIGHPEVRIRSLTLTSLLDTSSLSDDTLDEIDDILGAAVAGWSKNSRSDSEEIEVILEWLDRPALHDFRDHEANWSNMQGAMQDIRRLLVRGVDDLNRPVCRPLTHFSGEIKRSLRDIKEMTHQISRTLTSSLNDRNQLAPGAAQVVDAMRLELQQLVTSLSEQAAVPGPRWR